MVSSPAASTPRSARSRTGTPNPSGEPSRPARYGLRAAQKANTKPVTKIETQNLNNEDSAEDGEEDGGDEERDSKGAGSDPDDRGSSLRRASTRIAAKAAAREIAAQTAPSPPLSGGKRGSKGGRGAASSTGSAPSSRDGTPAPLSDQGALGKLADIASKAPKARKGRGGVPTARDLLVGIEATGSADVIEVTATDPNDVLAGFRQLEDWIDGGLDMYRPEFHPLLFPIFCHFYIDLVQQGFKDSALEFFRIHAPSLRDRHANEIHALSALLLPHHVTSSTFAQRLRSEKYVIRMSQSAYALFLGWLNEGTGGEPMGLGDSISSREGPGRRARLLVLKIVHSALKFTVTSASTSLGVSTLDHGATGLVGSLIPNQLGISRVSNSSDPTAFNTLQGALKLGPAPLTDSLRDEAERVLKEEDDAMAIDGAARTNGDVKPNTDTANAPSTSALDLSTINGTTGLVPPNHSDLLPHPPTFRSADLRREVERVRDARKRIKLDPSVLYGPGASVKSETNGFKSQPVASASKIPSAALPSICAYTFHDALDGINCSSFSEDSSFMVAGFTESYLRLWSLKKEKLKGLRSDFSINNITDPYSLRKIREKQGSSTRKLIGHSGPVFATSFDPVGGTAAPPKYLLSASADHTTRLWSLETLTNVVAYRGHKNPVWDVQWSPMGTYFATGSRDRTARLWSTERVNALRVFAGHLSDVDCVRFHPNSLYLATGSSDTTCRLWDVQRGSCMRVFIGHSGPITSIATSPDGRYLASASTDLSVNLWDLGSGRKIKSMTGHTAPINSLAFSACTTMLVSGGADWAVRCWDVKAPGGPPSKPARMNGILPDGALDEKEGREETVDLLQTFPTKRTPILNVQVTPRNLCLVAGTFMARE